MNIHPNEPNSRLEPLSSKQMKQQWLDTLAQIPGDGLKGDGFPHNVLGMLMYSPELFGPFLDYWVKSKLKMSLSVRQQELVILRMGVLYQSNYVWKHHVPVALEFAITQPELENLYSGSYDGNFNAKEQALLKLTDEMVVNRTISPTLWASQGSLLSAQEIVDLIMLISQYVLFALANNALQVPLEAPLEKIPGLEDINC
jgi:hypothetical protein